MTSSSKARLTDLTAGLKKTKANRSGMSVEASHARSCVCMCSGLANHVIVHDSTRQSCRPASGSSLLVVCLQACSSQRPPLVCTFGTFFSKTDAVIKGTKHWTDGLTHLSRPDSCRIQSAEGCRTVLLYPGKLTARLSNTMHMHLACGNEWRKSKQKHTAVLDEILCRS